METPAPAKSLWGIAGLCLLLLFPLAVAILTRFSAPPAEDAGRAAERLAAYQSLRSLDQKKLGTYAIIDPAKGTFQIPIERAIDLTIPELNRHPPAPVDPSPSP